MVRRGSTVMAGYTHYPWDGTQVRDDPFFVRLFVLAKMMACHPRVGSAHGMKLTLQVGPRQLNVNAGGRWTLRARPWQLSQSLPPPLTDCLEWAIVPSQSWKNSNFVSRNLFWKSTLFESNQMSDSTREQCVEPRWVRRQDNSASRDERILYMVFPTGLWYS